jgi:Ca2+-transporting ATPase
MTGGRYGSDVMKLGCDFIITDDSIESVIKAIKWGRSVKLAFQTYLCYWLTLNLTIVFVTLIGALFSFGEAVPFSVA